MKSIKEETEKTLNSLEGLSRAQANPFLYEKIMSRMAGTTRRVALLPRAVLWRAAAVLVLVAGINVLVCLSYANDRKMAQAAPPANDYGLNTGYYY